MRRWIVIMIMCSILFGCSNLDRQVIENYELLNNWDTIMQLNNALNED